MSSILQSEISTESIDDAEYYIDTKHGMWFYDRLEEREHAPNIYKKLIDSAEERIYIWEPYLQERDAELFKDIPRNIEVKILTCFNVNNSKCPHKGFIDKIKEYRNSNNFSLYIATIEEQDINNKLNKGIARTEHKRIGKKLPHDRFLFIDDRVFYVGASLNYHSAPNADRVSTTAIYEISEEENKSFLRQHYDSYWNNGKKSGFVINLYP